METSSLSKLHTDLSLRAKNGMDFTTAAAFIWAIVTVIWTMGWTPYNKSVMTFIAGGIMLPLAFLFSKIYKTTWKLPDNPLQPLGLWLNIAQLFYFPMLVFALIKMPEYFIMVYAIITGAHLLPYAWLYRTNAYAVMAGVISIGAMIFALMLKPADMWLVGLFTAVSLLVLTLLLFANLKSRAKG